MIFEIQRILHPRAVFLIMTPVHSNLGDHAIAKAEVRMLRELGISFIEIPGKTLVELNQNKRLGLMNGRPILINGGGNLGTLWPDVEELIRAVITSNPKSPIFVFPSTIYYEETPQGEEERRQSVEIYNHHPRLMLCARERYSYDLMCQLYRNVAIFPDVVLSMNASRKAKREGCILCLRSDQEKTLMDKDIATIKSVVVQDMGLAYKELDMVQGSSIPISERDFQLEKQFDAFSHARLVITDRMHGMVFAAITGTPCIVLNSKSPKMKGCYEWLCSLDYLCFCDDLAQLAAVFRELPKEGFQFDSAMFRNEFQELKMLLLEWIGRK